MIDLTGKKFGRLTGIKFSHKTKNRDYFWLFECECGNTKTINSASVRKGATKSCGCLAKETTSKVRRKHGLSNTKSYEVWNNLMSRCYNQLDPGYKNYGGRGITVSEEWHDFVNFYRDMGNPPKDKSIDRIDNDGPYSKENCRWKTWSQQNINRRHKKSNTGIRNISWSKRDNLYYVSIKRNNISYKKSFKELSDAIQWKEKTLKELNGQVQRLSKGKVSEN